jgi:hypothetical protein
MRVRMPRGIRVRLPRPYSLFERTEHRVPIHFLSALTELQQSCNSAATVLQQSRGIHVHMPRPYSLFERIRAEVCRSSVAALLQLCCSVPPLLCGSAGCCCLDTTCLRPHTLVASLRPHTLVVATLPELATSGAAPTAAALP